jgi:hypothetical protein
LTFGLDEGYSTVLQVVKGEGVVVEEVEYVGERNVPY